MALGLLGIFFIGVLFLSIITIIITLFSKNLKATQIGFIGTLILTGIVIFLTVTSLPSNDIKGQIVGLLPGIPALAALLMSFQDKEYGVNRLTRLVACAGLIGSVYILIFV